MNKGIKLMIKAFVALTIINGGIALLMLDSYNGEGLLALAVILNICLLVSMITAGSYAFDKCKKCDWDRFLHEENPDGTGVVCDKFKSKEPELFVQLLIYNSFILMLGGVIWLLAGISPWVDGKPIGAFVLIGGMAGCFSGFVALALSKLEGVKIVVKDDD